MTILLVVSFSLAAVLIVASLVIVSGPGDGHLRRTRQPPLTIAQHRATATPM